MNLSKRKELLFLRSPFVNILFDCKCYGIIHLRSAKVDSGIIKYHSKLFDAQSFCCLINIWQNWFNGTFVIKIIFQLKHYACISVFIKR